MSKNSVIETVDQIATYAKEKGIVHLSTQDDALNGNIIRIDNKEVVNYGSCSYLGLEFHPKINKAAKKAIDDYGTQFSASRAYISPKYYDELEEKMDEIFNAKTIVTPTTTLGHIAAIPVLVAPDDAVILDHQVHNSVQTAVQLVKAKGTHVEMIRHNRMDMLEERVRKLKEKHSKIWYMADGIYSMYGDLTPVDEVYELMNKHKELYYYVDDAHGMSCYGKNGRGYVLGNREIHKKMILATSFAKAFATGGGLLVFPTKELAQKVRNCGGPLLSSGPMQPSALGAAVAMADMHLSGEIKEYQEKLHENIKYTNLLLKKYGLPNMGEPISPIFFVAVSLPKVGYNLIERLLNDGYYLNIGIFPTVPIKNTGVRFTITGLHTFEQIASMVKAMAYHYPIALEEEGFTLEQVYKAFKLGIPEGTIGLPEEEKSTNGLDVLHAKTILDVNREEWDSLLGDRGTYDWNGLNVLENSFTGNDIPEQNWDFDYIVIKDDSGKPVLATFLTAAIAKDDMLMPEDISIEVEEKRKEDPYYLTSKTLAVGSFLTEGYHLYLDRTSKYWQKAMQILINKISELQDKYQATTLMIRDLDNSDDVMDNFMVDNGLFKVPSPENNSINKISWTNDEEFLASLSKRSKKHFKQDVLRHKDKFEVDVRSDLSEAELKHCYDLYMNVKNNSYGLNTFAIPFKFFKVIANNPNWEIITLKLKGAYDSRKNRKPVAVTFSHKGASQYSFLLVGIDYKYNNDHNSYRQAMYRVISRAQKAGYDKVALGYAATTEKRKFGATQADACTYMQVKDNFSLEALNSMSTNKKSKKEVHGTDKGRV